MPKSDIAKGVERDGPVSPRSPRRFPRRRARWKAAALTFAGVLGLIVGCGEGRPPPAADPTFTGVGATGGSSGGILGDAGSRKPPGCGESPDGSFCACDDAPLFTDAPNMYFVLDRSGSMGQDGKWTQVRIVVANLLRGLGPRANFGVTVFPGEGTDQCGTPNELIPITPGDPVGSAQDGPLTSKFLITTAADPTGGTPTAAALRSVLPILQSAKGKTFAILATDGAPNCNSQAACTVAQCQPNIEAVPGCPVDGPSCCDPPAGDGESCLDSAPSLSAVAALKAAGIPVFVIGLPGTSTYSTLLDQLAEAGGTALAGSPMYYKVDSTANSDALLAALKKIAAKIVATCEFTLQKAPTDPSLVNVYLDEVILPQDPANGWKISGTQVTLLGTACSRVLDGDVFDVRIITGCPTVGPR